MLTMRTINLGSPLDYDLDSSSGLGFEVDFQLKLIVGFSTIQ